MNELPALALFALIASGTPGPNNVMLWASGMQYGFRASLPHILGTALGLGSMALASAAGVGLLIEAIPQLELALKVVGSLYLLYLAYQVAGIGALRQRQLAKPLTLLQAITFQYVNPKAWFFALAAISTFRPVQLPALVGGMLVAAIMMAIILLTASAWAGVGSGLNRLIADEGTRRSLGLVLALALAATVVFLWI